MKQSSSILISMALSLAMIFSCEDITKDFTSGSFYPISDQNDMMDEDSMVQEEPTGPCWDESISVSHAVSFNRKFTRYSGWTGGDATYSVPLPDGRTLWMFGDSFIGLVNEDRSRPSSQFHRNAYVIEDGDHFDYLQGEQDAYLKPKEPGWWYWPGDGLVNGDSLQTILFGFRSTGSGAWDFEYASVDVATFALPEMKLLSIERMIENPAINFGASLLPYGGYVYIYGSEKDFLSKFMHTARVKANNLLGEWEFWDGSQWSKDLNKSARHFAHVSDQFCVFEDGGSFYLLTQHHILGGEIYLYHSDNPESGFINQKTVYCTPQTMEDNLFTYNAFAHTQFRSDDKLLVSYNVNTQQFSDLFNNADTYRPYFVWIEGWK